MAARTICKILQSLTLAFLICSFSFAQDNFLEAAYEKSAEESADFFFIGQSELDEDTFDQIRLLRSEVLLASSYKTLTEEDNINEVSFIFDATLGSAVILAGAREVTDFKILDASGKEVETNTSDFVVYSFINQRIISGTLPGSGPFKIVLAGKGESAITVRARLNAATTSYNFSPVKYEFGKLEAFIRYSKYSKLNRKPRGGEELQCTMLVKTPSENLDFELVSLAGDTLQDLSLKFVSRKNIGTIFRGPCTVPDKPFKYIIYREANGQRVAQRQMPELIRPLPAEPK